MARDRKRAKQRQRQRQRRGHQQTPRVPGERKPPGASEPVEDASAEAEVADATPAGDRPVPELQPDEFPQPDELEELGEETEPEADDEVEVEDELATDDEAPLETEKPSEASDAFGRPRARRAGGRAQSPGAELPQEGNRLVNFLRACVAELRRVQWPDRQQVTQATGVVVGFVIVAGAYLGLLDAVFSRLVKAIL